jgi:hypothetical protein
MANIETTLPGGEVYTAIPPTAAQWARFIGHVNAGNQRVGFRELAQVCASSHSPEEAAELLAKYPGAIRPLGEAIAELSTGAEESKVDGDSVVFLDMRFRAPSLDEWEDFQEAISKKGADQHALALELLEKLSSAPGAMTARASIHPGDVQEVTADVTRIAGMQIKIAVKKG